MNFTSEQQKVIDSRNQNLLVSAAAGSGKTAVLVERIIQRVMEQENPTDIDRMLVMTFTEAAAGEMKERIGNAIEARLREEPNDKHLQKQSLLIHNAPITTIHGFCLNVVKNHFHEIDIDPGFRVADEGECRLLKADVMEQVLEAAYEGAEENFVYMAECYGAKKSDSAIEDLVGKLYTYAMSHPYPGEWLTACKEAYETRGITRVEDYAWCEDIMRDITNTLADIREQAEHILQLCTEPQGPYMYERAVQADIEIMERLLRCHTYSQYREAFSKVVFETLGRSKSGDDVDPVKKDIAKGLRDDYKKMIDRLKEQYFYETEDNLLNDMKQSKRAVDALIDLTSEFMAAYDTAKREKNIIDFDDMEHMALRILLTKENGELHPTKTANEYRDYFSEILVDEYQDSNLVQEYLINSISKETNEAADLHNVFMVGDVKQSIYRFRLARPELFMDKYHKYPVAGESVSGAETVPSIRIDLHQNFRSRKNVLNTVNDIFAQIMRSEVGGISYDDAAALYYGAEYPETTPPSETTSSSDTAEQLPVSDVPPSALSSQTEYIIIENNNENNNANDGANNSRTDVIDKRELEAKAIADRIQRFVNEESIWDKKEKKYRKISYSDIVILLRTNKGFDETYKRILEEAGIPAHVASKTGYFSVSEVETLLEFLRILDNPLQDIPLAASMKSVFGGFNDEELALIRCTSKKYVLYDAVCEFAKREDVNALTNKVNRFLALIQYYRDKIPYTSVYYLMNELIQKTGYIYYVSASPNGEQRRANVNMLLEKANDYGKTSYKGLFHFVRYIEYLKKYDVDYGEASLANENDNAVRIMSIHKSKGLEFPICFLAATDKGMNQQDARTSVILDADYGLGVDCIDPVMRLKSPTLLKRVMQKKAKTETLAEELRLLYVALTRAEQKIVLTGVVDDFAKKLQHYCTISGNESALIPTTTILSISSFEDMLFYSLIRHPALKEKLEEYGLPMSNRLNLFQSDIQTSVIGIENLVATQLQKAIVNDTIKEQLLSIGDSEQTKQTEQTEQNDLLHQIEKRFSFQYPYEEDQNRRMKMSVSELKKRHMQEELPESAELLQPKEIVPYIPNFILETQEVSAVQKGTAYHKLLELLDYGEIEALEQQIVGFCEAGFITDEAAKTIRMNEMIHFCQSSVAGRMAMAAKHGQLHREQPFVVYDSDEEILIQGIVDAYFEEDGELVVVDYKTDRVHQPEELIDRYKVQLDYYAKALQQLTGMYVKEKIIYSFELGREVPVVESNAHL